MITLDTPPSPSLDDGIGAVELSIVMPCLDEAETLAVCIDKAQRFLADHGVTGEVVIADNGSTDGSREIAVEHGARLIAVPKRGYGAALLAGIEAARGTYVIMGDSDDSYDFTRLMPFLQALRSGADLVMGNRFQGGIAPGAMPPLHRYLGNPVLSVTGRIFTGAPIGDFHCGLRGFRRESILALDLRTPGMEFASEMVVLAQYNRLRIVEVPATLSPDGRSRPPHLRSWNDGWRHLRFLLTFAPNWLFLYPGLALFSGGLLGTAILIGADIMIGSVGLGIHTLLFATAAVLIGAQLTSFWYLGQLFGVREGHWPASRPFKRLCAMITVDAAALWGTVLLLLGLILAVIAFAGWAQESFGSLDGEKTTTRLVIGSVLASALGVQLAMTGFMASLLSGRGD